MHNTDHSFRGAALEAARLPDTLTALPLQCRRPESNVQEALDVADVTNSLRSLIVRRMGIVRERTGLLEAEQTVAFWCRYALTHHLGSRAGWELQNLLTVAQLMIWAALQRQESRGVHYRSDFPSRDDRHWQRHLTCPGRMEEKIRAPRGS